MRLELSNEGRYALRALVYLARSGERVAASRIASEAAIPPRLLARILARLGQVGLVDNTQGRGGGSRLARPAAEIAVGQIVSAVEGPFAVHRCIMEERACGAGQRCPMHELWSAAQRAMLDELGRVTLASIIPDLDERLQGAAGSVAD